ncbi:sigma-70 family RNA polymerase sigma factor [Herbidospora sp. NEAU-GS84]|uniref:Sigma-70 family RNA polymerase sigma factor n=1 Tax=Herbidospora solisilvae TaxID=2696284 RepID=A0A7C9NDS4_9ACTN|nr:sigma-70 family RNA polymerase sigma factor [Herbidospora solisilvae]NAS22155.1 sigma-70 family RNA polymerase sigma factor [Herbidospora solisilvae]
MPPSDLDTIAAIDDPFRLIRVATERLNAAQQEVAELARLRRRVIQDLHAQGMSYAAIAEKAGLSRGRIHQIRHTGPAPEGAFFGAGTAIVVTPLRHDAATGRSMVALDDLRAGKRLEDLARSFGLTVATDNVTVDGQIDLNRSGLLVICGPRMSEAMRTAYDTDPAIRWDRDDIGWKLLDTRTGQQYRSGSQVQPARPMDSAFLGRLPRPDGKGTFLAIAGIHPSGSLGVIHLLSEELATIWGQVDEHRFSCVVAVEYDPETGEPVRAELASPLYRHADA